MPPNTSTDTNTNPSSSSFSFSFSGDDIAADSDADADTNVNAEHAPQRTRAAAKALLEPRVHGLEELLAALPPSLTYTTLTLPAAAASPGSSSITIPRRDLFDIRLQLMSEDPLSPEPGSEQPLAGLGNDDIDPNIYEGGLKSWECSLDLVRVLARDGGERGPGAGLGVLELGCGTALPTLYLFQQALRSPPATPTRFALADYNPSVLRLVTLPNLLLSWAMLANPPSDPWPAASTLRVTPALLSSFAASLQTKNLTLSFLSGAWSPKLTNLLTPLGQESIDLVLASETIYSPLSLRAFTRTIIGVLRNRNRDGGGGGRALVAAKMVYFGVGGGVREFLRVLREEDGEGVAGEEAVVFEGGEEAGVKRVVVELRGT